MGTEILEATELVKEDCRFSKYRMPSIDEAITVEVRDGKETDVQWSGGPAPEPYYVQRLD